MKKHLFIIFILISCSLFSQKIREGSSNFGTILYNFDGKNLRQGSSSFGTVLYNFDGKNIRQGSSSFGTILFNIDGGIIPKPILMILCM